MTPVRIRSGIPQVRAGSSVGEHRAGSAGVAGSSPARSTNMKESDNEKRAYSEAPN